MNSVHTDPAVETVSRAAYWERGVTYRDFLAAAEEYPELWARNYERAEISEALVERAEAVPGEWRLLVVTEDWCIDAVATIPTLAAFADAVPSIELRVVSRDENPELMDDHLTRGTARAIPVVVLLDGGGVERGWWGPRPADLLAWFYGAGQELEKDERYRELRKWYARDKGQTTLLEVVGLIEEAGGAGGVA